LYNWATAKTVCPDGWRLPSRAEWDVLINFVDANNAGGHLKSKENWNSCGTSGSIQSLNKTVAAAPPSGYEPPVKLVCGVDTYGFTALPGGLGSSDGSFNSVGQDGFWWVTNELDSYYAYCTHMSYNNEYAFSSANDKNFLLSVRCLQN
jgi:uncharacterized protein (TIGR02145 family)